MPECNLLPIFSQNGKTFFALDFLGSWNKEQHVNLGIPFNSNQLFQCLESTDFAREHYKYLMLDLTGPFPAFLISNLWFSVEQWGLTSLQVPSR